MDWLISCLNLSFLKFCIPRSSELVTLALALARALHNLAQSPRFTTKASINSTHRNPDQSRWDLHIPYPRPCTENIGKESRSHCEYCTGIVLYCTVPRFVYSLDLHGLSSSEDKFFMPSIPILPTSFSAGSKTDLVIREKIAVTTNREDAIDERRKSNQYSRQSSK